MKIKFLIALLGVSSFALAESASVGIDEELALYIKDFKLKPVNEVAFDQPQLFWAGEWLFSDPIISGNRNISCLDCHNPNKGSGDGIALSLGEGSLSSDSQRRQLEGNLIPRHSPVLFNVAAPEFDELFWDGRVSYRKGIFQTPEPRLNGKNPEAAHIANVLTRALDAQVMFPMLSHEEMRGAPGTNEIANEPDNLKAWALIVERIKNELPRIYQDLVESFPGEEINIGHVARSISHFIKLRFQVWNTPYDNYLRGDLAALDEKSKRGMKIFFTKGRCGNCHWGKHLTNHAFQSVAVPPLGVEGGKIDKGLMDLTGDPRHAYLFKNPGLRNVSKSAPYMHNGAFETLDQVIEHYNSMEQSLRDYQPSARSQGPYRVELVSDKSVTDELWETIFQPFLRRGLGLSGKESEELKHFLIFGLTQKY